MAGEDGQAGGKVGEGGGHTVGRAVGGKVGEGGWHTVGRAVGGKVGEGGGHTVGRAVGGKVGEGGGGRLSMVRAVVLPALGTWTKMKRNWSLTSACPCACRGARAPRSNGDAASQRNAAGGGAPSAARSSPATPSRVRLQAVPANTRVPAPLCCARPPSSSAPIACTRAPRSAAACRRRAACCAAARGQRVNGSKGAAGKWLQA